VWLVIGGTNMIDLTNKSGIYCITNLVNGKKYFGQSINLKDRFSDYRTGQFHNDHLRNSVNKYGWENFTLKPFIYCAEEYLNVMEKYFIKKYKTMKPKLGYNKREGGEGGGRHSEESKRKNSETKLEYYKTHDAPCKGRKYTEEQINDLIKNRKDMFENNPEIKEKISLSVKKLWESDEYRKHMSDVHKGYKKSEETMKKIRKELEGIHIKTGEKIHFSSVRNATQNGFSSISRSLRKNIPCKGYKFSYKEKN